MNSTFFLQLIPPRPTFAEDMTAEERALMQLHLAYTRSVFNAGKLLLFGPVLAPEGTFGIAVLHAADEEEVKDFIAHDPTVIAGLHRYTYAPMLLGGAQALPA